MPWPIVGPPPSTSHRPRHGTSKYSAGRYQSVSHVATSGLPSAPVAEQADEPLRAVAETMLEDGQSRHSGLARHRHESVHLGEAQGGGLLDEHRHSGAQGFDCEGHVRLRRCADVHEVDVLRGEQRVRLV